MGEVRNDPGGDVAEPEVPGARQDALHGLGRERGNARTGDQGARVGGVEPAVGRGIEHTRQVAGGDEHERRREVVDVDDLHRHRRAPHAQRGAAEQDARGQALGAGPDDRRRAQCRDRDVGMLRPPLREQALHLGALHRG